MKPPVDVDPHGRATLAEAQLRWRHEVAGLGGRTTLLWHRDLADGTFDLTVAHPGGVAKLLAGVSTRLSELVREPIALQEARRRVRAIRATTAALQREHGLTTCFIAVGMVSWQLERSPVTPRAPVLLRGCTIRPTDASHRDFTLMLHRDVVFNPVLEHYLRGEAGIQLDPARLAALSTGGNGFDPRPTYRALEKLCADLPGFGIGPQMVIGSYPWAKLPLVAAFSTDLSGWAGSGLVDALAARRAVRAAEGPNPRPRGDGDVAVLDADRAQRRVLGLARQGRSLVVDAAPGTGRTQTAANLVAAAVLDGRSVLVLAEHQPTLRALRARLARVGLGHLVLQLWETPEGTRALAKDLLTSLETHLTAPRPALPHDPLAELSRSLHRLRAHERSMHEPRAPWDATLARAQLELTALAARERPPASRVRIDRATLETLVGARLDDVAQALVHAADIGAWERGRSEDPWYGAAVTDGADADRARDVVLRLVSGQLAEAREAVGTVCAAAGLPTPLTLRQGEEYLDLMGRVRETLDVFRPQIYEAPLEDLVAATARRGDPGRPPLLVRNRLLRQVRALLRPGTPPPDLGDRVAAAHAERLEWEALAGRAARPVTPPGWEEAVDAFAPVVDDLTWLGSVLEHTASGRDVRTTHLDLLLERLLRLEARSDRLPVTARAYAVLQPLRERGLGALVDDLARRGVAAADVPSEVHLAYWASVLDQMAPGGGADHDGAALREDEDTYADADHAHLAATAARVRLTAYERAAAAVQAHPGEVERLRGQRVKVAGADSTAVHLDGVSTLAQALRPVWVGSPLVVPATVPERVRFDLVVVDESSRVTLAHAVPGLLRGAQVVALGDSAAVPPRFTPVAERRDREPAAAGPAAPETVLSALATVLPVLTLDTDYRSVDQRLVLPLAKQAQPHPAEGYPGVLRSPRVTHALAEEVEGVVESVVEQVVEHARGTPWQSLAVLAPDDALTARLDHALRERIAGTDQARSFREDAAEALLLTSLSRTSGEARDRVILALPPGPELDLPRAAAGLAVARRSVLVVSSTLPQEWPESAGLDLLRAALRCSTVPQPTVAPSPLLLDLAARLRAEGLRVHEGYGVGRHALELAVDDPEEPGRPLLAVLTDGRPVEDGPDRDHVRLRPEQLARLGWAPVRVWSTDLFRDPAREVARLVTAAREASAARARR